MTAIFRNGKKYGGTSNASIQIDNALSTTSTNPVQNKVVTEAIESLKLPTFDARYAVNGTLNKTIDFKTLFDISSTYGYRDYAFRVTACANVYGQPTNSVVEYIFAAGYDPSASDKFNKTIVVEQNTAIGQSLTLDNDCVLSWTANSSVSVCSIRVDLI